MPRIMLIVQNIRGNSVSVVHLGCIGLSFTRLGWPVSPLPPFPPLPHPFLPPTPPSLPSPLGVLPLPQMDVGALTLKVKLLQAALGKLNGEAAAASAQSAAAAEHHLPLWSRPTPPGPYGSALTSRETTAGAAAGLSYAGGAHPSSQVLPGCERAIRIVNRMLSGAQVRCVEVWTEETLQGLV